MKFLPILCIAVALVVCAFATPAPDHTANRDKRSPFIDKLMEAGKSVIGGAAGGATGVMEAAGQVAKTGMDAVKGGMGVAAGAMGKMAGGA